MLTWTELQTKAQNLAKDTSAATLTQLKQDMNTGYHLFNTKLSRYFSRKQQFTDLIADQQLYQTPIDSVRVMGITCYVGNSYQIPLKEIRSEYQWRQITSYPTSSNWPTYYFVQGNDLVGIWPTPSDTVVNGMRFYYQEDDTDLSVEDITSTTTGATVTVTNGSPTVTATASVFGLSKATLSFQTTGTTDISWYEITGATGTTLTLKSAFVGPSASGVNFRVGQLPIIPQAYQDIIVNYALWNYFEAQGNTARASYHKRMYDDRQRDAMEEFSSSNTSSVLTDDGDLLNPWLFNPLPYP